MSEEVPASVRSWLGRIPEDRPVALLLRHAARDELPPGEAGYALPITAAGRAASEALGRLLGERLQAVYVSPLLRTTQTGVHLIRGAQLELEVQPDAMLGDPGAFVVDDEAGRTWAELGHEEVMRHIVHEDAPLPGLAAPDSAARFLAHHLLRRAESPGVHVFVTHDSLVTGMTSRLSGGPFGVEDWPEFLEGAFVWREEAGVVIAYRERRALRESPLVGGELPDLIYLWRRHEAGTPGLELLREDCAELVSSILCDEVLPRLRDPGAERGPLLRWALRGVQLLPASMDLEILEWDLLLPNAAESWTPASLLFTDKAWEGDGRFTRDLPPEHRLASPATLIAMVELPEAELRLLLQRLGVSPTPALRALRVTAPIWRRTGNLTPLPVAASPPVPSVSWTRWRHRYQIAQGSNWPHHTDVEPYDVRWVKGLECPTLSARVADWVLAHPEGFEAGLTCGWWNRHIGQRNSLYNPWVLALRDMDPPSVPSEPGSAGAGARLRPSELFADAPGDALGMEHVRLVAPTLSPAFVRALGIRTLQESSVLRVIAALQCLAARPDLAELARAPEAARLLWTACYRRHHEDDLSPLLDAPVPLWVGGRLAPVALASLGRLRVDDSPAWSHLLPGPEGLAVLDLGQSSGCNPFQVGALRRLLGDERVELVSELPMPEGWAPIGEATSLRAYLVEAFGDWFPEELERVIDRGGGRGQPGSAKHRLGEAQLQRTAAPGDAAIWRSEDKTLYVSDGLSESPHALLRATWAVLGEPWRESWLAWADASCIGGSARRAALPPEG